MVYKSLKHLFLYYMANAFRHKYSYIHPKYKKNMGKTVSKCYICLVFVKQ